jgi:signal transduction histidine kinase
VAIVAACIVFAVGLSIYTNRITRGIVRLSHAAENMGSGDLATAITFNGSDELAQLAGEMDRMRVSVVRQMENERVAMQANKDLITAISHDIRTPLTTMLGYLDLLTDGQYASEEEKDKYIGIVRNKSMEFKSLTDRLFRYFLAFGEKDIEPEMDAYDAGILMEQMVAERLLELKDLGWKVESAVDIAEGGVICVDVEFLKRVVDNVISNIKKHADPDGRIFAWIHEEDGKLSIYVANGIPKVPRKAESTKIGLKICTKLMEQMGGEFHTYAEENRFAAEIVIPIIHTEG